MVDGSPVARTHACDASTALASARSRPLIGTPRSCINPRLIQVPIALALPPTTPSG